MNRLVLLSALAVPLAACADSDTSDDSVTQVEEPAGTTDPAYAQPMDPIEGDGEFQTLETLSYACEDGTTLTVDWNYREGPDGREMQPRARADDGTPVTLRREDRFGPFVGNGNELIGGVEAERIELNGQRCERTE